jgi:hypothetical protein
MTSIHSIQPSSFRNADAPIAHRAQEAKTFTRGTRTDDAGAVVAGKDKARISQAALVRELDATFPTPGKYHFAYENKAAIVERLPSGTLQIRNPGDRLVKISDGVITYEHVMQGDLLSWLTAAKHAQ